MPGRPGPASDADLRRQLATTRPLVPTATIGGVVAAGAPLLVCLAVAVVGWFLTDAGGEGAPSGALRVGAHGWLMAHGSTVAVEGVHPHDVGTILDEAQVAIRAGHHCAQPLMAHLGVPATARASFGVYNGPDDIAALVRGIERVTRIFA